MGFRKLSLQGLRARQLREELEVVFLVSALLGFRQKSAESRLRFGGLFVIPELVEIRQFSRSHGNSEYKGKKKMGHTRF